MYRLTASALAFGTITMFALSVDALAQEAPLPVATSLPATVQSFLPANTEIRLRMNQEVTTKGDRWSGGYTFNLSVVQDVRLSGYVVIPAGSRAVGRITWLTNKGAFGKSGKMEVDLEYVEVAGRRIGLDGNFRQEGEGNTVATVAGVIAAGVFAGFITGKSGTIPEGRELTAHTEADVAVALPEGTILRPQAVAVHVGTAPEPHAAPASLEAASLMPASAE
jgi:hypothetical protein